MSECQHTLRPPVRVVLVGYVISFVGQAGRHGTRQARRCSGSGSLHAPPRPVKAVMAAVRRPLSLGTDRPFSYSTLTTVLTPPRPSLTYSRVTWAPPSTMLLYTVRYCERFDSCQWRPWVLRTPSLFGPRTRGSPYMSFRDIPSSHCYIKGVRMR